METNEHINPLKEAQNLASVKKEGHFSVPVDYFESLPENIIKKIQGEVKERFWLLKPSFIIPSLSALSLLFVFYYFFFNSRNVSSNEQVLSEIDIQHIIDNPEFYNLDNADITNEYLAIHVEEAMLAEDLNLSDDDIKLYLEDNTDVSNTIINEY